MDCTAKISEAQAWAIANVLNDAGMDVTVHHVMGRDGSRPGFRGADGTHIVAAAAVVAAGRGRVAEEMPAATDWLMVSFEATVSSPCDGIWSSLELGWA